VFRAVATTIIPEAGRLGPGEWEDVEAIIDRALYFVGHNYDATGGLYNISRDARLAAGRIAGRHARASP
jgi:hypothetical protein